MAAPTIRDVARLAGVSVASVSRAMNGTAKVNQATRDRIADASRVLGYVPHAGARSLSTAQSNAIGVVLPDVFGEFFSELVRGLDREASAQGYHLLLANIHADAALAAEAIRTMRGRVDGLIVMAPQIAPAALAQALPYDVPTVLLNHDGSDEHASFRIDNHGGALAMTRFLVERGCRRIVHITGGLENVDARERLQGYREALGDLPEHVIEGDFHEDSGAAAARELLASRATFDAIFAANDMMALGALLVLREAGVDVPGAVAVAGFDDVPIARHLGLTTMRVDIADMGARAAARLVASLRGRPLSSGSDLAATHLTIRKTTP